MNKKRILALTLGIMMSSAMFINPAIVEAKSKDEVQSQINANNEKIDALEDKKAGLQGEKSDSLKKLEEARKVYDEQQKLLTKTRQEVLKFEDEINNLQEQIDALEVQLKGVEKQIADAKNKILEKEEELNVKEEILGQRLRSTYMNNIGDRMLYMIIESKNLGDLISNIANINIIIKTDQELMSEIKADKDAIEIERQNLVKKESELNNSKLKIQKSQDEVKNAKSEVDALNAEYEAEAVKLKSLEDERSREYNSLTSEEKALDEAIRKYEHENVNLEEYFKNTSTGTSTTPPPVTGGNNSSSSNNNSGTSNNSGGGTSNSKGFVRPVNAPISSHYGYRIHPVTGVKKHHNGTDYAASTGTPIKAIASGTVTTAGWHNAFGNMVIVDHGNGYTSLYAHASSLNVRAGQTVSQGQVVSYVGSTGLSTGPHLHLEMRYNGSLVNPESYIG
ncbi:MAG: peptidoglycan DD-metalloendopeptidase family protein [Sarcina sp.]